MYFNFEDLIEEGLVKKKVYPDGLSVVKYARKVFYDNLWHKSDLLLEARGLVLNEEGMAVVWPFTKVFNYKENGTDVPDSTLVIAIKKVNGFMLSVRYINGELIFSTTGSLDSDFVRLGRETLLAQADLTALKKSAAWETLIFEITHEDDPHIVEEKQGAWLIGARDMVNGDMLYEPYLDGLAERMGVYRPTWVRTTFGQAKALAENANHEGFMIRDANTLKTLMKIKSPYYLAKKFLMRMSKNKLNMIWSEHQNWKAIVKDEEFFPMVEYIKNTFPRETWEGMSEQERGAIVQRFFEKEIL